ncbi:ATP-binding protein [Streptomyces sp. NPDC058619]|uniref:ATP-binding protein n=1 Tax=unclassified Streptomyces TaxID=2593676 RepID=UPI00364A7009
MRMIETAGTGDPSYSQVMPREAASASPARQLTAAALHVWGLADAEDAAAAVVTELVSNAVAYACRDVVRVTMTKTGERTVRIAAVDFSHALPEPRTSGPADEHGRGLAIVAALCDGRWGTDPLRWGKRVWGELTVPEAKPDE